ncbi:gcs-1 [Symbiodinium sp. CCMP2592]|nr:gcs-1 [Symbiodinium sp. CCMP2592]
MAPSSGGAVGAERKRMMDLAAMEAATSSTQLTLPVSYRKFRGVAPRNYVLKAMLEGEHASIEDFLERLNEDASAVVGSAVLVDELFRVREALVLLWTEQLTKRCDGDPPWVERLQAMGHFPSTTLWFADGDFGLAPAEAYRDASVQQQRGSREQVAAALPPSSGRPGAGADAELVTRPAAGEIEEDAGLAGPPEVEATHHGDAALPLQPAARCSSVRAPTREPRKIKEDPWKDKEPPSPASPCLLGNMFSKTGRSGPPLRVALLAAMASCQSPASCEPAGVDFLGGPLGATAQGGSAIEQSCGTDFLGGPIWTVPQAHAYPSASVDHVQPVQQSLPCLPVCAQFGLPALQRCFAFLQGVRVGEAKHPGPRGPPAVITWNWHLGFRFGEASHPGPAEPTSRGDGCHPPFPSWVLGPPRRQQPAPVPLGPLGFECAPRCCVTGRRAPAGEPMLSVCHDWKRGCRLGEASHPGPGFNLDLGNLGDSLGDSIMKSIKEQIQKAVDEAVKQALASLNLGRGLAAARPSGDPDRAGGRQSAAKGKGKSEDKSGPAKVAQCGGPGDSGQRRGKGKGGCGEAGGQEAGDGWQIVPRKAPEGAFKLRKSDWDAPVVEYAALAEFIDKADASKVLELVVFVSADQVTLATNILQGSGLSFKALLVFLSKDEEAQRIPGTIGDRLVFRTAKVQKLTSAGASGHAPQPTGLSQTSIKIKPTESAVVYFKVPKQFASADTWKAFGGNASKAAVDWVAAQRIKVLDTFAWVLEKQRNDTHEQYFGIVRIPKADIEGILAHSGKDGVFVDAARTSGPGAKLQWIEKLPGEKVDAYFERALRQASSLGLVVNGGRLAWRSAMAAGEATVRIWHIDGVPHEWDADAVGQLLATRFTEYTILSHRRTRLGSCFRFRGQPGTADTDLVPFIVEHQEKPLSLWATLAPFRVVSKKQKPLASKAVPVVALEQPVVATIVKPPTGELATGEDGKEVPQQKRVKQEVRTKPGDLQLKACPRDGACVLHAISLGLQWLGDSRPNHPRMLRAQMVEHMRRHVTQYEKEWDGKGPDSEPVKDRDFSAYLTLMEKEGAYCSDVELRALGRVLDIKIDNHVDLMLPPEGHKKYPSEYAQITAGSPGIRLDHLDAGERLGECCGAALDRSPALFARCKAKALHGSQTKPRGEPQARSSQATAQARPSGTKRKAVECTSSVFTCTSTGTIEAFDESEFERARAPPKRCPWLAHATAPADLTFRCNLCPYKRKATSNHQYYHIRHNHYQRAHEGQGLQPDIGRPKLTRVCGPRAQFIWCCPFCNKGITHETRKDLSRFSYYALRNQHCAQAHPEVSKAEWQRLAALPQTGPKDRQVHAKGCRQRNLTKAVFAQVRTPRFGDQMQLFVWPRARCEKRSTRVKHVLLEHGWKCLRCGECTRDLAAAKQHSEGVGPACRRRSRLLLPGAPCCRGCQACHLHANPLLAVFIKLLSINANRTAIPKVDLCADFLQSCGAELLSLQEADINPLSAQGFGERWRAHGYRAVLSDIDAAEGVHRVALVASLPMHRVNLKLPPHVAARCAAGAFEMQAAGSKCIILVVAFYGFPGQPAATAQALGEVRRAAATFGGPYILLGDFNVDQSERQAVVQLLCDGELRSLDEADWTQAGPTNPTRTRRIDFGLAHWSIIATAVKQFERPNLSDHGCVFYETRCLSRADSFSMPKFRELPATATEDILSNFGRVWDAAHFESSIAGGALDEAWAFLSDVAERTLGATSLFDASGARRSDHWLPCARHESHHRVGPQGHESQSLRSSRKLLGQLHQLRQQPHCQKLWRAVGRRPGLLRATFPDLPVIHAANLAGATQVISHLHAELQQQETEARVHRWRRRVEEDPSRALAWVKRKADHKLAMEQSPQAPAGVPSSVHPASIVEEHGKVWLQHWKPESPVNFDAVQRILDRVPGGPQSDIVLQVEAEALMRATKAMRGKAMGPDRWSAELLLRLPVQWWEAAATLWNAVLSTKYVPRLWRRALIALVPKRLDEYRPIALCPVIWRAGAHCISRNVLPWMDTWLGHHTLGGAPCRGPGDAHARLFHAWQSGGKVFCQQDLTRFFDSLDVKAVGMVLRHLGAPVNLAELLASFYQDASRLFLHEGRSSRASDSFDQAFGFQCRASKCAVVCPPDVGTFDQWASARSYPRVTTLKVLGITLDMQEGALGLLTFSPRLLLHRLRFLKLLGGEVPQLRRIVLQLVHSAMFWAGGVACPARPPAWLDTAGLDVACGDWRRFLPGAAAVVQRLGWQVHGNGLAPPSTRAGERLFAAEIPEYPAAPAASDFENTLQSIVAHLRNFATVGERLLIATDGSAKFDVGGCAVIFGSGDGTFVFGDACEDQSAFRCELLTLTTLFEAISRAQLAPGCQVGILVDCSSALQAVAQPGACSMPLLAHKAARLLRDVRAGGLDLKLSWTPAHGRRPNWTAPWGLTAARCRDLNERADAAANSIREHRARGSGRVSWHAELHRAALWERGAILASAGASNVLAQHLRAGMMDLAAMEAATSSTQLILPVSYRKFRGVAPRNYVLKAMLEGEHASIEDFLERLNEDASAVVGSAVLVDELFRVREALVLLWTEQLTKRCDGDPPWVERLQAMGHFPSTTLWFADGDFGLAPAEAYRDANVQQQRGSREQVAAGLPPSGGRPGAGADAEMVTQPAAGEIEENAELAGPSEVEATNHGDAALPLQPDKEPPSPASPCLLGNMFSKTGPFGAPSESVDFLGGPLGATAQGGSVIEQSCGTDFLGGPIWTVPQAHAYPSASVDHVQPEQQSLQPTDAYFERALRQASSLGLVVNGGRLAWRSAMAAGEATVRIWHIDGVPHEWDVDAVGQLLATRFTEYTILSHRRTRLGSCFRFRGQPATADTDLVPFVVEHQEKPLSLWATLAPFRVVSKKQKPLASKAVPVVALEQPVAATIVKPPTGELATGEDGKEVPQQKRVKQEVRTKPGDLQLKACPRDGACVLHALSLGLQWLGDSRPNHPRMLRAQMVEHMRRHATQYEKEWDGKGPDSEPVKDRDFPAYLTLMEKEGAYCSDVELRALGRVLDIKIVVLPAGLNFAPYAFHSKAAKMLVLWYEDNHVDLMLPPEGHKKYPSEYAQITAGPVFGLRAGGRGPPSVFTASSAACVRSQPSSPWTSVMEGEGAKSQARPASVWTTSMPASASASAAGRPSIGAQPSLQGRRPRSQVSQARSSGSRVSSQAKVQALSRPCPPSARCKAKALHGPQTRPRGEPQARSSQATAQARPSGTKRKAVELCTSSVFTCTSAGTIEAFDESEVERARVPPKRCPWLAHATAPADLTFRCNLCPYKRKATSNHQYYHIRHNHYQRAHEGQGLQPDIGRPKLTRVCGPRAQFIWCCPFCNKGITHETRKDLSRFSYYALRNQHRAQAHPEVTKAEWQRLAALPQTGPKDRQVHAKGCRQRNLTKAVFAQVRTPRFGDQMQLFVWPRARCEKRSTRVKHVLLEHGWKCLRCGECTRDLAAAKQHSEGAPCCRGCQACHLHANPLLAVFVKLLSINANRTAISKVDLCADFLQSCGAELLSLQEADINPLSAQGFGERWRAHGYRAVLSDIDAAKGVHRVALVASLPVHRVNLKLPPHVAARCAAGAFEMQAAGSKCITLVVAFYGFPGQPAATAQALGEVRRAAATFGGPYILLGDFNVDQSDQAVVQLLCDGELRSLDEADWTQAGPTNPTRTRRIDFGLAHWSIIATAVKQFERPHLSDHGCVFYETRCLSRADSFSMPKFRELPATATEDILSNFGRVWDAAHFESSIAGGALDEAWAFLSDVAERTLGATSLFDASGARRSDHWLPCARHESHHRVGPQGHESQSLRSSRKLLGQLHQLRQQPHCQKLWRAVGRRAGLLRATFPDLPVIHAANLAGATQVISHLHAELQQQETEARVHRWRCRVEEDPSRALAWVKRKADHQLAMEQSPQAHAGVPSSVHPASIVEEHGKVWLQHWKPESPVNFDAVQRILDRVPGGPQSDIVLQVEAEALMRATKAMRGKAMGPDRWSAELLLRLPVPWWEAAATLWNAVLSTKYVPRLWRRALIALVPKRLDEYRPIALCPVIWRAGAHCISRNVLPWMDTWLGHHTLGGAPCRGPGDAHARLFHAWQSGGKVFCQQDLTRFFDSLDVQAVGMVLRHLGAPAGLAEPLTSFYQDASRLFLHEGRSSSAWGSPARGLAQGCPLSPMAAVAVGHIWAMWVQSFAKGRTDCLIFIDDRVLWPSCSCADPLGAMDVALRASDSFDQAFGFQCRASKCAVVCPPDVGTFDQWASARSYPRVTTLKVLGITLDMQEGALGLLKFSPRLLLHRLRFLKLLGGEVPQLRRIVLQLVHSAMFWAGGVACPDRDCLRDVWHSTCAVLQKHATFESPKVLLCASFGWSLDPEWAADWASLRAAWRFKARPPAWLDTAGLDVACGDWRRFLPGAAAVVQRLGWQVQGNGAILARLDDSGTLRQCHLGWESFDVVKRWLVDHYKWQGVHSCGRIRNRGHRDDATLARGLSLGAPLRSARFALEGHRLAVAAEPTREVRLAALGSGGSIWYHCKRLEMSSPDTTACVCGLLQPSRAHLTWCCTSTTGLRQGLAPPSTRAGERLFAAEITEYPAAPAASDVENILQSIVAHLRNFATVGERLLIATDGSAKFDVGGCAVIFGSGDGTFVFGDACEDQSAFRCELLTLTTLFEAISRAQLAPGCQVGILVDCNSALQAVAHPEACSMPLLAHKAARLLRDVRAGGLDLKLSWTPAHGRRPNWTAPWGLTADRCRDLNDRADAAANSIREHRARGSGRVSWHAELHRAALWERGAILASAGASNVLAQHLRARRPARLIHDDP